MMTQKEVELPMTLHTKGIQVQKIRKRVLNLMVMMMLGSL
jgi:hypothetical protein